MLLMIVIVVLVSGAAGTGIAGGRMRRRWRNRQIVQAEASKGITELEQFLADDARRPRRRNG